MDLQQLYKQLILEESRNPAYKRDLPGATHCGQGKNPSCGDELELKLKVNPQTKLIEDCAFQGVGCAISTASASIMAQLLIGKTVEEAKALLTDFLQLIRTGEVDQETEERLAEAMAFADIAHMPARVKCAVMAWHTALDLLGGDAEAILADQDLIE